MKKEELRIKLCQKIDNFVKQYDDNSEIWNEHLEEWYLVEEILKIFKEYTKGKCSVLYEDLEELNKRDMKKKKKKSKCCGEPLLWATLKFEDRDELTKEGYWYCSKCGKEIKN